jgi:tRNA G10  N-methylase Trm11
VSQTLYILGRQPAIGAAELESLLGPEATRRIGDFAVVSSHAGNFIPFSRLGGSTRACKILTVLPYTEWHKIVDYIVSAAPQFLAYLPEGKLHLGVSVFGLNVGPQRINASALTLKKVIKSAGKSVRVVPNKATELNAAQVIHNRLLGSSGWELVLVRDGNQTILAQTTDIQDIDAYAARDQRRPKRDARVGMLPPKLAQIIVNIGSHGNNHYGSVVLDPFCGTGVILQEAALMEFDIYGSDLDDRMVQYSDENLMWLLNQPVCPVKRPPETLQDETWRYFKLEQGDATSHQWQPMPNFIACETYLGRPFATEPKPDVLQQVVQDVDTIHRKFLQNVARQTNVGFRMCIAVPAWKTRNGFKHLKVLDSLEELGYTRQSFVHARNEDLIYHRSEQIVGRELVVLIRK